jgi:hypothetical protein
MIFEYWNALTEAQQLGTAAGGIAAVSYLLGHIIGRWRGKRRWYGSNGKTFPDASKSKKTARLRNG